VRTTAEVINAMKEQVLADLQAVRAATPPEAEEPLVSLETFVAIALRVFSKTNTSKIKEAMQLVEIQARMDGKEVFE
jgi:hypothetical protein